MTSFEDPFKESTSKKMLLETANLFREVKNSLNNILCEEIPVLPVDTRIPVMDFLTYRILCKINQLRALLPSSIRLKSKIVILKYLYQELKNHRHQSTVKSNYLSLKRLRLHPLTCMKKYSLLQISILASLPAPK